jgi:hypothetical protein
MARPKKVIDPKLVQDLASIGCKTTEIAAIVGASVDTLDRRFAEEMNKGRNNLRCSLRRWQLDAAKKGNVTMLIWLGKQLLDQKDVARMEHEAGDQGFQITVNDLTKKPNEN